MTQLSGKIHTKCKIDGTPLIYSTKWPQKCQCDIKECLEWCEFDCNVCLCKICFKACDQNIFTYVKNTSEPTFNMENET